MATEESKAAPEGQPQQQNQNAPDPEQLQKSIAAARQVLQAQGAASVLKEQAKQALNPKERMRLLQEAYNKEVEAHGQSKYAKRLQSGPWQGAAAGGGIGGGVAMGVGTVVGTLVGGVTALPTVLLGGLVGAGVGGVHGPFIKLGGGKKGETPMTEEQMKAQAVEEAKKLDEAVDKSANTVPVPPDAAEQGILDAAAGGSEGDASEGAPTKRKPRKLEVRSAKEATPSPERRKPKKLEVRSSPSPQP